jgi:hypothetical protein
MIDNDAEMTEIERGVVAALFGRRAVLAPTVVVRKKRKLVGAPEKDAIERPVAEIYCTDWVDGSLRDCVFKAYLHVEGKRVLTREVLFGDRIRSVVTGYKRDGYKVIFTMSDSAGYPG